MGSDRTRPETPPFILRLDELLLLVILAAILTAAAASVFQEKERLRGERARVLSPDGKLIAVISWAGNAVFDVEGGAVRYRLQEGAGAPAFSPDSRVLAIRLPGGFAILDSHTGKEVAVLGGRYKAGPARFSPDGSQIAFLAPLVKEVHVWDVGSKALLRTIHPELDRLHALDFLPGGALLVGGDGPVDGFGVTGGVLTIWDVRTGDRKAWFPDERLIRHLAVSSDGSRIASSEGRPVRIRDPRTGTVVREIEASARDVLTFSRDGQLLVTTLVGTAMVHSVEDGRRVAALRGSAGHLCDAVFVDGGKRLVTAGEHGTVFEWEIASGRKLWRRRGLTLLPDPIPWAVLVVFAGWLAVWGVLSWTRSKKARQAGERPDSGPWVLGLLATVFVANCLSWISLFTARGSRDGPLTAGLALTLIALAVAMVVLLGTLRWWGARSGRRIVFCVLNLVLAAAVVVPNFVYMIPRH